ncbi:MAG: ParB N-terminal domain-containing protein [Patescibacteria group bacterium]|nr:ParB N-terminal domain-containing protein [Patescibacteria group bacterium]
MVVIKHDLKVELVPVDALKPSIYNPRKWSAKQIADLKESIRRFGIDAPTLVNSQKGRSNHGGNKT